MYLPPLRWISWSTITEMSNMELAEAHSAIHGLYDLGDTSALLQTVHGWIAQEIGARGLTHPHLSDLDDNLGFVDPPYEPVEMRPIPVTIIKSLPDWLRPVADRPEEHGWDDKAKSHAWFDEASEGVVAVSKALAGGGTIFRPLPDNASESQVRAWQLKWAGEADMLLQLSKSYPNSKSIAERIAAFGIRKGVDDIRKLIISGEGFSEERVAKQLAFTVTKFAGDEQIVAGPVLIPGIVDGQGDRIDADAIASIEKKFRAKHAGGDARLGIQHSTFPNGLELRKSWILDKDETHNGRTFPAGTWFVEWKVHDIEIWKSIRAGKLTGFSISGPGSGYYLDRRAA